VSEVKVNKISPRSGTDVTLGDASDTFTIPASATLDVNGTIDVTGATVTGLNAGTSWQSVQTTGFTAVAGKGYPCNTTGGTFIVTLPASASVGDTIELVDYAGTFNSRPLTLDPQSLNLKGSTDDLSLKRLREGVRLVYMDATQGWLVATSNAETPALTPVA